MNFSIRKYNVLLFDLGGVLADFRGFAELTKLLPRSMSPEKIHERWLISPAIRKFETGKCTAHEFASDFISEWNLSMNPDQFLSLFKSWLVGPYEGALKILIPLKDKYVLACLSNCNELHWNVLEDSGFGSIFNYMFSSHEIGVAKPDIAIFKYVVSQLCVSPQAIAFFDDSRISVEQAREVGIDAYQVKGVEELARKLRELGVIQDDISE